MAFIPHTEEDIQQMLAAIGATSVDMLFDEIPASLKLNRELNIPSSLNEMQISRLMQSRAKQDADYISFLGAGAYEHHIPAAVWELTSRGEFLTAYTPYQAEASQGGLQLIYEYQTMIASLTGMDVSNASLYGGATALAEAVLMSVRCNKKCKSKKILFAGTLNPFYKDTVITLVSSQGIELIELPFDVTTGRVELTSLNDFEEDTYAALIISQPNFLGCLEQVDALTDWAHKQKAVVIAAVNPTSLALLKSPGQYGEAGADIVCGEGQPLGVPLASGGPYFGFMACKKELVRQMPGRIVGRTVDQEGKEGFTLTLQAREQHIRRGKAKSNICTNQGLLVTAASIYMSLLGPEGLKQVALASHANTKKLVECLSKIPGVKRAFNTPFFHEVVVLFDQPVKKFLAYCESKKVLAGFDLTEYFPQLGNALLICATETKTDEEIDELVRLIEEAL